MTLVQARWPPQQQTDRPGEWQDRAADLEVGGGLRVAAAAGGLVQQVAEHVEQEEDGEQVQEGEEALVVVQRAKESRVC
jgi:hypothetical protein